METEGNIVLILESYTVTWLRLKKRRRSDLVSVARSVSSKQEESLQPTSRGLLLDTEETEAQRHKLE